MKIPEKPPNENEFADVWLKFKPSSPEMEKIFSLTKIVNAEYMHWDELKHDNRLNSVDRKILWGFAHQSRQFNARRIRANGIQLQYVQTPEIEKRLHEIDVETGGKIVEEKDETIQNKYLVSSIMEEAIASSQLEGAATSRLAAKQMLREKRKPRNDSEKMIVNAYNTMKFIRENESKTLTLDLIKEIHKRITKGTLEKDEYEGAFRTTSEIKVCSRDAPGEVIYNPPDHEKIVEMLKGVCEFANAESPEYYLHPVVKAIILHYLFGWIHPFNDGNGRTARAVFYWFLVTRDYPSFEYIAVSRTIKNAPAEYARAYLYAETDGNDVTYFVKFNLRSIERAVKAFREYVERKKAENKKMIEIVKHNPALNARQADLLVNLNKNERLLSITEARERYGVTYQTARSDLLLLAERGFLKQIKRGKKFLFSLNKEKLEESAARQRS